MYYRIHYTYVIEFDTKTDVEVDSEVEAAAKAHALLGGAHTFTAPIGARRDVHWEFGGVQTAVVSLEPMGTSLRADPLSPTGWRVVPRPHAPGAANN
jgi:hypothetical protein